MMRQTALSLLLLLFVAAAARSPSPRQSIQGLDDSETDFATVFLQTHSSVRAASLDRATTAVKDCDVPQDTNTPPCCSGVQCPFKGGMCCAGSKTCCPGGTSCMDAIEGVPQQCQSIAYMRDAADTLDAKVKYLKAASAEKARRTQIILNQVALMTTGGINTNPPAPQQPRCTGPQPCVAADLLAPNSFAASSLQNPDGSALSDQQAAALQTNSPAEPVEDPNPYVPRQPSPERKDTTCVCPPVAPCGSNWCAPPPRCACDLFWSTSLQHQGRIALDDQEPGDEDYNSRANNGSNAGMDIAAALARAAAEAEAKAAAQRAADERAAAEDAAALQSLFDSKDGASASAAHSLAVQQAKVISESVKMLDEIGPMDLPELAPPVNLTRPPALNTTDNTISALDPENDPYVLGKRGRGANVGPRKPDDEDDMRDDGPPQPGDDDVFQRSDVLSQEIARQDSASRHRHQQTNIVLNLKLARNGSMPFGGFGNKAKIPKTDPVDVAVEPEAKDADDAREEKETKNAQRKQEVLARKLLNRRKLETRTEYCVSRSPASKGPLRTLMTANDPNCGADHAPTFESYARFYAFPSPVSGSQSFCVSTTRGSLWRMQITPDATTCVSTSWNQEFVFYAYPDYHPGTAPFCIKESTNGNQVKRQYIDPGRTSCTSNYWKQIGVFYAFQSQGDPSLVPTVVEASEDSEDSEQSTNESSEESTQASVKAGPGAVSNVTPVRFAAASLSADPPVPPGHQPRFREAQRMPAPPPTPTGFTAPRLSLREKASRDEKAWKDMMGRLNPANHL